MVFVLKVKWQTNVGNTAATDTGELKSDGGFANIISYTNVTMSEEMRYRLDYEIHRLESMLPRALLEDSRDWNAEEQRKIPINQNSHFCEISILQWPMLFGEACILGLNYSFYIF